MVLVVVAVIGAIMLILVAVFLLMAAWAQLDLRRVRRRHGLSDAETESYARELPVMGDAIAANMPQMPDESYRQYRKRLRKDARKATLDNILERR